MRAAALGVLCTAIASALFGLAATRAAAGVDVRGASVTLRWAPAAGPVQHYLVYVSRDGSRMKAEKVVKRNRATLGGKPGQTIQVQVAAWGPEGVGMGPPSPLSPLIRFSPASAPRSGGRRARAPEDPRKESRDGGSKSERNRREGDDLPSYTSTPLVTMEKEWEVLGTGDFVGDGDDDVLFRFSEGDGVYVLEVSDGRVARTRLVAWEARSASRGPWRGDRHTVLVNTSDGRLEGWAFGERGPARRWGVRQSELLESMAGDLDGDAVEEVLRRFGNGSLRLSNGKQLPVADLRAREKVLVAEGRGGAHDDLVVTDLRSGRIDLWREGRRRRSAPTLEANLDDLTLARLGGREPWLVGVDSGGRLRARRLDDPATRTLGFVGRGARVHPFDADGDGRDELIALRNDELTLWHRGR